jgi:DNA-binding beta-propeller fold protein YncE
MVRATVAAAVLVATALVSVALAPSAFASGPTITAVTFAGTPTYPTVTVWGSGFGDQADLGTPQSAGTECGPTGSGSNYQTNFYFDEQYEGWAAGEGGSGGDCVGLLIESYSDSEVTFAFGSSYSQYGQMETSDNYLVTLLGATYGGTVSYGSTHPGTGPFAYVEDNGNGNGTVSAVDTTDYESVGSPISVGTGLSGLVASPNGADVFVARGSAGTVSEISTSTNQIVDTFNVPNATDIAVSPDGSTVYVTGGLSTDDLYPIDLATSTVGTPIDVGSSADALALTPDGTQAFVGTGNSVVPVDLTHSTVGNPIATGFTTGVSQIKMSPSGSTAYASGFGSPPYETIVPINVSSDTTGTDIDACHYDSGSKFALSPSGSTAWVACNGSGSLEEIDLSTDLSVGTFPLGEGGSDATAGVAVSPDGSIVYVVDSTAGAVVPFDVTSQIADAPITAVAANAGVYITPDQGPTAAVTASSAGLTTTFTATGSVAGTSPIAQYSWNFGDGSPVTFTPTATISHTYATAGTYTATVTESDSAGTSDFQLYTGQSAVDEGTSAAVASVQVVVAAQGCTEDSTCTAAVTVPATPTTPIQSLSVAAKTPTGSSQILNVSSGPGTLTCAGPTYQLVGNVNSYKATFTPTGNVKVTDLLQGATSTAGITVCFKGSGPATTLLPTCSPAVPPCISSLRVVTGGVKLVLKVPPGDPRWKINGVEAAVESPSGIPTSAIIGKKFKITGTELLGPNGQSVPSVGFTSVGGSVVTAPIVSATATSIKVRVPNGAAKGPVTLVWPQETAVSETVQIT